MKALSNSDNAFILLSDVIDSIIYLITDLLNSEGETSNLFLKIPGICFVKKSLFLQQFPHSVLRQNSAEITMASFSITTRLFCINGVFLCKWIF